MEATIIIGVIVSIIVGVVGMQMFKKNEVKVIDLQKEKQKFLDNEQDVPETLDKDLTKAHTVSLNFKKLQLLGISASSTLVVVGIIKLFLK